MPLKKLFSLIIVGICSFVILGVHVLVFMYINSLWGQQLLHWPPLDFFYLIILYGIVAYWNTDVYWKNVLHSIVLVGILFSLYLSMQVTQLGDTSTWVRDSQTTIVWGSNILASLLYRFAYLHQLDFNYLAPVDGALVGIIVFLCFDYLNRLLQKSGLHNPHYKFYFALLYLGSGVQLLFFRGYIETTMYSLPFLALYIYFGLRYLSRQEKNFNFNIVYATICLTLACLTHGANTFLIPSLPLLIFIKSVYQHFSIYRLIELVMCLAIGAVLAFVIIHAVGTTYQFRNDDVNGGPDGPFVPLQLTVDSQFTHYTMFSLAHFQIITNALLLMSPLLLVLPWLLLYSYRKTKRSLFNTAEDIFLMILSLGAVAFVTLWNFDLGFPRDYDLIIFLGLTVMLTVGLQLRHINIKPIFFMPILAGGMLYIWLVIYPLLLL